MVTKKDVMDVLKKVYDPEIGINIVDLGFIYDVKADKDKVYVKMTLTTPGCPLHAAFTHKVEDAVKALGAKDVKVELTFDPPWTPEKMSKEARKSLGYEL